MARLPIGRSRRVWRDRLIACLLLALVWPAAGPLPWLALEADDHAAGTFAHSPAPHADLAHVEVDAPPGGADAMPDAVGVPGSPTHPLDHHCAQCEVLKHLARCVPSQLCEPSIAPAPGEPVFAVVGIEPLHASFVAARPPIRGPPAASL